MVGWLTIECEWLQTLAHSLSVIASTSFVIKNFLLLSLASTSFCSSSPSSWCWCMAMQMHIHQRLVCTIQIKSIHYTNWAQTLLSNRRGAPIPDHVQSRPLPKQMEMELVKEVVASSKQQTDWLIWMNERTNESNGRTMDWRTGLLSLSDHVIPYFRIWIRVWKVSSSCSGIVQ